MAAINMDHQQFASMMEAGMLTLVNFWAPWCSYCRRIDRAYERIAAKYADHMVVAKVNVDEDPQLAQKEQIEVLPTLVMYRGGGAIGSIVAPESQAMIDAFIQESLGNDTGIC